jgi:hypothetical protein
MKTLLDESNQEILAQQGRFGSKLKKNRVQVQEYLLKSVASVLPTSGRNKKYRDTLNLPRFENSRG